MELEQIVMEQISAGDRLTFHGPDKVFTIRSIRDGMVKGRGFRTTDGDYFTLPWGYKVDRVVR